MDTFLKLIDKGLMVLCFTKFKDDLNITNAVNDVAIRPKEVALRTLAEKRGKSSLEFLNLWRETTTFSWPRQRSPLAREGMLMAFTDTNNTDITRASAVPVDLQYNLWAWSVDLDKINSVIETYLFWQHTNPNLDLTFNEVHPVQFDLKFGAAVDTSPVEDIYEKGVYYGVRLPIQVEGWVMKLDSLKTIKTAVLKDYLEGKDGNILLRSQTIDLTV